MTAPASPPPAQATVPLPARLRHASLATGGVFFLSGFLIAAWIARLPATRDRVTASPGQLGVVLLAMGLGSLVSMPVTGRLCARYGSRRIVAATALPACGVLVALALLPDVVTLGLGLLVFGMAYGAWDVAMNVHGSHVDSRTGRDLMPRYHGLWSAGGISGAGLGALAARADLDLPGHFSAVAVVVAVTLLAALTFFVPDAEPRATTAAAGEDGSPRARLLSRGLVAIGLVTLCGTCIEGAAADWLALYLTDERGAPPDVAASGYATFALAMVVARLSAPPLIARLGRFPVVRIGGLVTGAGILLTVFGPGLPSALVGALLWGAGVAVVFPAAMSAGGEQPGRAADGIAAVSTIGYGGFLLGPPLIGLLAERTGLGPALLVLLVLAAGVVLLAPAVRPRRAARRRTGEPATAERP